MNMWHAKVKKKNHGLSLIQSYPHTCFQHNKQTSIMHETLLKCKCDAMHELFNIIWTKPIPKILQKTSLILKNPKIFQKPQKLGQKRWNAWLNERNRIILEEENDLEAKDWVGKRFRVREGCLGRWGGRKSRERSRKMSEKSRWSFI